MDVILWIFGLLGWASAGFIGRQLWLYKGKIILLETSITNEQRETKRLQAFQADLHSQIHQLTDTIGKRPELTRRVYKIITVGVSGTGKTGLTLKWANPLSDLGNLKGTRFQCYERVVSLKEENGIVTQHVFQVHDWGGENIVDAHAELLECNEIHGLLFVVDLCDPPVRPKSTTSANDTAKFPPVKVPRVVSDSTNRAGSQIQGISDSRIAFQLTQFVPEALQFFFGEKITSHCKTVVLFINKSDVIGGTPNEVDRLAKEKYQSLIDNMKKYDDVLHRIELQVMVGSATSGHNTHHLFSHFVQHILPSSAYDATLLQRQDPSEDAV